MLATSLLWQEIVSADFSTEYKVEINGVTYGMGDMTELFIDTPLFDKFSVGNVCSAELDITIIPKGEIPKMSAIDVFARVYNDDSVSEWLNLGEYFIDTRAYKTSTELQITALDGILKSEILFVEPTMNFPMTMTQALNHISQKIGIAIHPNTVLNNFNIEYTNELTMREVLGYIAAAHGGNWILSENKLLLMSIVPIDTGLDFGQRMQDFELFNTYSPISKVTMWWGDEEAFVAGDDTGLNLEIDCLWATQAIADSVLLSVKGYEYIPYSSLSLLYDPRLELGDGITLNGVYSVVTHIKMSSNGFADVEAIGSDEIDNEYYYVPRTEQELDRVVKLNQKYFGVSITRTEGIKIQNTDGLEVYAEAVFNTNELSFKAADRNGVMQDKIYFDVVNGNYVFDGILSADVIEAISGLVTPVLTATKGYIAELTVDELDTSDKVQKYLAEDLSDVEYTRIQDQNIELVVGKTTGTQTEQVQTRKGDLMYWTDDTFTASGIDETDYPVMQYVYETEYTALQMSFLQDPSTGFRNPMIQLGQGTGVGNRGKGFIHKTDEGVFLDYYSAADGELRRIGLTDDGLLMTPMQLEQLDFYTDGFDATYSNNVVSMKWTKDAEGKITELRTTQGDVIPVIWH